MTFSDILSVSEHRILLGLALLCCLFVYAGIGIKNITAYNGRIAAEEREKYLDAMNSDREKFHFNVCGDGVHGWQTLLSTQYIFTPFIFVMLLNAKSSKRFTAAMLINSVNVYAFYGWIDNSLRFGKDALGEEYYRLPFNEILLSRSTSADFYLLLPVLALFILQIFILVRALSVRRSMDSSYL